MGIQKRVLNGFGLGLALTLIAFTLFYQLIGRDNGFCPYRFGYLDNDEVTSLGIEKLLDHIDYYKSKFPEEYTEVLEYSDQDIFLSLNENCCEAPVFTSKIVSTVQGVKPRSRNLSELGVSRKARYEGQIRATQNELAPPVPDMGRHRPPARF